METGGPNPTKFEHLDHESLEELFSTLADWNHQLKHSEIEVWETEEAMAAPEEPQP